MISAEIPKDEDLRLLDLDFYDILDAETDANFDEITELAAQICNCPISLISFLDKDRQWFKIKKGHKLTQTLKDISICTHVLFTDKIMVIENTKKDSRFFNMNLGVGEMHIRFFASAPILLSTGRRLGTICVIDNQPKKISAGQQNSLVILSGRVAKLFELHKKNLLIRKLAEEIIERKNKAITKTMNEHEEANITIALNLHEDMAQSVAACIHYLKIAENNQEERIQQIKAVETELGIVLNNIRKLSYAIKPNTMEWMPVEDLIQEFTKKIEESFSFNIQFNAIGNETSVHAEKALLIMRIIEHWLKKLNNFKSVSTVKITVNTSKQFELLIEDNGKELSFDELKEELFDSLVFEIVRSQNGEVDLCHSADWNLLQIALPDVT